MKKKDPGQTFSIMRKPIKVDGEDVRISPAQLYHRLLCIASTNGPPDPDIFVSRCITRRQYSSAKKQASISLQHA